MRTTLQIILAVKGCEPVTEDELRMALLAMSGIDHFTHRTLRDLVDACEGANETAVQLQAVMASGYLKRHFKYVKTDPEKFLGPGGIPGKPEYDKRREWARAVFKKATGVDLSDPGAREENQEG